MQDTLDTGPKMMSLDLLDFWMKSLMNSGFMTMPLQPGLRHDSKAETCDDLPQKARAKAKAPRDESSFSADLAKGVLTPPMTRMNCLPMVKGMLPA